MDALDGCLRFEGYELDTLRRELRRDGVALPLTSKAFDVLGVLVARRPEVISREALMAAVWPGRVVEENNLTQAIAAIRRALGGDAHDRRYVVTVPGRGYRFAAEVTTVDAAMVLPAPLPESVEPSSRGRWKLALLASALLLVAFPVGMQAIRAKWPAAAGERAAATVSAARGVSLVVLPFRFHQEAGDPMVGLGIADTLANRLARTPGLRLLSVGAVQRAGRTGQTPREVARALGADYVLDGSVQRRGDRLQVVAQLRSVADGQLLWSNRLEVPESAVFTLDERMARGVVAAFSLPPAAAGPLSAPCEGGDPVAYAALLRARYRLHHRDMTTVQAFQEAVRLDPTCARAYAGMATAYLFTIYNDADPREVLPLARAAAAQALRIDPQSAEAMTAYARALQLGEWQWAEAEAWLRKAIARNPNLPEARLGLGNLLSCLGRFDEGLAELRSARALDPLSPLINSVEAGFLTAAQRTPEARGAVARALQVAPDFWIALTVRAGMALDAGAPAAAVADLERAVAVAGRNSQVLAMLATAYVANGQRPRAQALLDELQARAQREYVPATSLATVWLALGQRAAAVAELERGYRETDVRMMFLGVDARWNPVRAEPGFLALLRSLRLQPAVGHSRL